MGSLRTLSLFSQGRFSRSVVINSKFLEGGKVDKDISLEGLPLITHIGPMKGDKFGINVEFSNTQNPQKGNDSLHKIVRPLSLDVLKSAAEYSSELLQKGFRLVRALNFKRQKTNLI